MEYEYKKPTLKASKAELKVICKFIKVLNKFSDDCDDFSLWDVFDEIEKVATEAKKKDSYSTSKYYNFNYDIKN